MEKSTKKPETILINNFAGSPAPKSKRGTKKGRVNRARRQHKDLTIKEEIIAILEDQLCCPECGEAYQKFPKLEDSEIIEIHVDAHIRRIKREFSSILKGWIKTLQLWKISPYTWFYIYLQTCAAE